MAVAPFPKVTATFSEEEKAKGLAWARRRRVELLEARTSGKANESSPTFACTAHPSAQYMPELVLENIRMADVFATFKELSLDLGHGSQSDHSRLSKLQEWFGHLTLSQLDYIFITKWLAARQSGKFGSGRNPKRVPSVLAMDGTIRDLKPSEAASRGADSATILTKQKAYSLRKKGVKCATTPIFPVSTQTLRHELMLIRRCLKCYSNATSMVQKHSAWLAAQYIMTMELPSASPARTRRTDDKELCLILKALPVHHREVVTFAFIVGLRRSEIVSLRWEDFSPSRGVILLNNPGYSNCSKSKTVEREVPLLPGAICLLSRLQADKTEGKIFPMCPASLSQVWRRAADTAGAYDLRFHDARREALSRLAEEWNLSLPEIALVSGHQDLETLDKHYICLKPTTLSAKFAAIPLSEQPRVPGTVG